MWNEVRIPKKLREELLKKEKLSFRLTVMRMVLTCTLEIPFLLQVLLLCSLVSARIVLKQTDAHE